MRSPARVFRRLRAAVVAAAVAATATATAVPILLSATPASACVVDADGDCSLTVQGTVEATAGLNVRTQPWGTSLDTLPNQYRNTVSCYVQASDGSYWDWIYDSRIGRSGWVYDPLLYTGGAINTQVDQMSEGNCAYFELPVPVTVTATAIGTHAIKIHWTDLTGGHARYVVNNGNVSSRDLAPGTTSYTWTGLSGGQWMCFFVAAKLGGDQSPWAPQVCTFAWRFPAKWIASSTSNGRHPSDVINLIMTRQSARNILELLYEGLDTLPASRYGPWRDSSGCSSAVYADMAGRWRAPLFYQRQDGCGAFRSGADHLRVWTSGFWYYFSASTERVCLRSKHCLDSFNAGRDRLMSDIESVARRHGWHLSVVSVAAYRAGSIKTAVGHAPYDGRVDIFRLS